jgi:hypothetical protein
MEPSAADIYGRDLLAGPATFPHRLLDARAPVPGEALAGEVPKVLGLQRRYRAPAEER